MPRGSAHRRWTTDVANQRAPRAPRIVGQPNDPSDLAARAFEEFRSGLYRLLLRRLRNSETAEDLAQEVYLRLLRTADPAGVRCPQAYVYRIAFNVLYEFRLRERDRPMVFDSAIVDHATDQLPDAAARPDEVYERTAQMREFEQIVQQLPPMQRAVLRLATHHTLSHAQMAEKLGISVSTVRNHLYKAIDHCRHRFASEPAAPVRKES